MSFGLVIAADDLQTGNGCFAYYWDGVEAFSSSGRFNPADSASAFPIGTGFTGPFFSGTKKLVILQTASNVAGVIGDIPPVTIQAWLADGNNTFARTDQADETTILADASLPNNWPIGVVQSSLNTNIVYVVYWNGNGTPGSSRLALRPFNMSTGLWGTAIVSGLGSTQSPSSRQPMIGYVAANDCVVFATNTINTGLGGQRCQYARCFPNGAGWDVSFTSLGDLANNTDAWEPLTAAVDTSGNVHFLMLHLDATPVSKVYHQVLHSDNTLSAYQLAWSGAAFVNILGGGNSNISPLIITDTEMIFPCIIGAGPPSVASLLRAPISDNPGTWTVTSLFPALTSVIGIGIVNDGGTLRAFANDSTAVNTVFESDGPTFAAVTNLGTIAGLATSNADILMASTPLSSPAVTVVAKSLGGGGTLFPRVVNKTLLYASLERDYAPISSFFLFANDFDVCLANDFNEYNRIDYNGVSCSRLPSCFLDARNGELDPPKGFIAFNPVKSIALPAPADGDVVVFSFRVPYGYDGLILAQFHQYTQNYTQGSGDLIWRVRADRRYLRDTGNMQVSIGNSKQLSPVYGGLRIYSGNLVEYIVSAPNTSGLLPPPGTGNILAGLHGYLYPRK